MKCICVNIFNPSAMGIENIPNRKDSQFSLFGKNPSPNLMQTAIKISGEPMRLTPEFPKESPIAFAYGSGQQPEIITRMPTFQDQAPGQSHGEGRVWG